MSKLKKLSLLRRNSKEYIQSIGLHTPNTVVESAAVAFASSIPLSNHQIHAVSQAMQPERSLMKRNNVLMMFGMSSESEWSNFCQHQIVENMMSEVLEIESFAVESETPQEKSRREILEQIEQGASDEIRAYLATLSEQLASDMETAYASGGTPAEINAEIDRVISENEQALRVAIERGVTEAYVRAGREFVANATIAQSITASFGLINDRAVNSVRDQTDRAITLITNSTRNQIDRLLRKALSEGLSGQELAGSIRDLIEPGGLWGKEDVNGQDRADRIATNELRMAMEQSHYDQAKTFKDDGFTVTKFWQTAGDSRVRDSHRANQSVGWVELDTAYSATGTVLPPTDSKCRCVSLYDIAP